MTGVGDPADRQPTDVQQVIVHRVRDQASEWFPDLPPSAAVRIEPFSSTQRSRLYAITVGTSASPQILAKVRHPHRVPIDHAVSGRPMLGEGRIAAADQTALEYAGLCHIHTVFAEGGDPRFGAIRPLDHLKAHNTILMSFVPGRTLKRLLEWQNRLSLRRSAHGTDSSGVWRRVGEWLRTYQSSLPVDGMPSRQSQRDEVVEHFVKLDDYLSRQLRGRGPGDVARRGAALAARALPDRLPTAVGHGDFAPRNMLVSSDGRLTVFDPLPRWAVPAQEDLCRFLVGMRLQGIQLHSHGAAYGRESVERREWQAIAGYYADAGEVPHAQLRLYELLLLLDKWSALVESRGNGAAARLRGLSLHVASGYLTNQARRLLVLAEGPGTR